MLAIVAAVLFAIGFIINAAHISTDAVFNPFSFLLLGLVSLALFLAGVGRTWRWNSPRRRTRR
jgi:drug/metabolite transporter (DMT)-like permease